MNKEKLFYTAPEAETLVVRFEGMICVSGDGLPEFTPDPEEDW